MSRLTTVAQMIQQVHVHVHFTFYMDLHGYVLIEVPTL